jgi:DNA invertase Pin-like site-specific DNA recombinase
LSGAGLEAQRRAITAECKRRRWELVETIEDAGYSAKDMKRPGVQEALRSLELVMRRRSSIRRSTG